jgi:hypothetical protein
MPVLVSCSCGKRLRVPDAHAGKRIKCPGCGEPLSVPAADATAPEEEERDTRSRVRSDKPEPKRPAPATRGKNWDEEDEEDERPRKGRSSRAEDEEDEEEERPRKKTAKVKKGANRMLILGGVALVGLFCFILPAGLAALDYFFFNLVLGGGNIRDLSMVPPDAQGFVTVRVADVWKLDTAQRWLREAREKGGMNVDPVKEVEDNTGLAPADVERFTLVMQDDNFGVTQNGWFIVQTVNKYDRDKILSKLKNVREVKHEGKTYRVGTSAKAPAAAPPALAGPKGKGPVGPGPAGPSNEVAVFFAGSRVLVFAPEKGLKSCLSYLANPRKDGLLTGAIEAAGGKRHLIGAFRLPAAAKASLAQIPQQYDKFKSLANALSFTVAADIGDVLQLELTGRYSNDNQAKDAKAALDGLKSLAELIGLPMLEGQIKQMGMPADQAKKATDAARATLNSLTVEQKGADVVLQVKIDTKAFEGLRPPAGAAPPAVRPKVKGKG